MRPLTIFLVLGLILLQSCGGKQVTRLDPESETDLTGKWNDRDARMVAEEMMKDVMERPWLNNFKEREGREPVVIVGLIQNQTHEHIDSEVFVRSLERHFVNTGEVRVVQRGQFREKMREERADQQEFAAPETQQRWGRELGADYMVNGYISSIVEEERRRTFFGAKTEKIIYYKVNLELSHLETNEKAWIGEKEIKKQVKN